MTTMNVADGTGDGHCAFPQDSVYDDGLDPWNCHRIVSGWGDPPAGETRSETRQVELTRDERIADAPADRRSWVHSVVF